MAGYKLSNGINVTINARGYTENDGATSIRLGIETSASLTYGGGWIQSNGAVGYGYINGSHTGTKTVIGNGEYIASGSTKYNWWWLDISKSHSSQTISWSIDLYNSVDGYQGSYLGSQSGSITIGAKYSYTVSYDANGGSAAPGNQTKWHGETLTLSSTSPTRTGYTFKGWATSSSATTATVQPGDSYTTNGAITYYAVWQINTWKVTYDANSGSGAPNEQIKTYGVDLTLSSTKPTKNLYDFVGWGTSATATTASYQPGSKYTANEAIKLYAIWKLAYISPTVSIVSCYRSNADGIGVDDGNYGKVTFRGFADRTISDTNVIASAKVEYKVNTSSSWTTAQTFSPNVQNYENSVVIPNLSTEEQYDIRVTVSDSYGATLSGATYTVTATSYISKAFLTMDFLAGGHGIAFGQPSSKEGFVCAMDAEFLGAVKATTFSGNATSATQAGGLWSDDTRSENNAPDYYMSIGRSLKNEFKNASSIGISGASNTYVNCFTIIPWKDASGGRPSQIAIDPGKRIYMRSSSSNTDWGSWSQIYGPGSANQVQAKVTNGTISSSSTPSVSVTITTSGNPVGLAFFGDVNVINGTHSWCHVYIKRGSTTLRHQVVEAFNDSCNVAFGLFYVDAVGAGTYTYTASMPYGAGAFQLNENGTEEFPVLHAFEIR